MKIVDAATNKESTATYYIDVYGDIFDNKGDAEITGIAGKVIVDGFYVGSAEEMRSAALKKYMCS